MCHTKEKFYSKFPSRVDILVIMAFPESEGLWMMANFILEFKDIALTEAQQSG
jgi:hypothetical protein